MKRGAAAAYYVSLYLWLVRKAGVRRETIVFPV